MICRQKRWDEGIRLRCGKSYLVDIEMAEGIGLSVVREWPAATLCDVLREVIQCTSRFCAGENTGHQSQPHEMDQTAWMTHRPHATRCVQRIGPRFRSSGEPSGRIRKESRTLKTASSAEETHVPDPFHQIYPT